MNKQIIVILSTCGELVTDQNSTGGGKSCLMKKIKKEKHKRVEHKMYPKTVNILVSKETQIPTMRRAKFPITQLS